MLNGISLVFAWGADCRHGHVGDGQKATKGTKGFRFYVAALRSLRVPWVWAGMQHGDDRRRAKLSGTALVFPSAASWDNPCWSVYRRSIPSSSRSRARPHGQSFGSRTSPACTGCFDVMKRAQSVFRVPHVSVETNPHERKGAFAAENFVRPCGRRKRFSSSQPLGRRGPRQIPF